MYVAMNRFRITLGREDEFLDIWKSRKSYLDSVPGFRGFNLLQGSKRDDHTLFATHVIWDSQQDFENWTKSAAFRQAHANAGKTRVPGLYLGPPQFEGFNAVVG